MNRLALGIAALIPLGCHAHGPRALTENVFLVTVDGLRSEEVFEGAAARLIDPKEGGVESPEKLRAAFWRPTAEASRAALLPFFWGVMAARGQVFRNARVTNGTNISYPGYSEILTGRVDPGITTNDPKPNPNATVLEWLNGRPAYGGRVACFSSWEVMPFIVNQARAGFLVNAGRVPSPENPQGLLDRMIREVDSPWDYLRYDAFTYQAALGYVRRHEPRVVYLAFGDTDDWAHDKRYDRYLQAMRRIDAYLAELWDILQSMSRYRGKTSLVLTTDHGRGHVEWTTHGKEVVGSDRIFIAVMGPDTPPLGVREEPATQSQVAATVTALLGEDFAASGLVGRPLDGVVRLGGAP